MNQPLMYCPQCGTENRPNQKFCRKCGLSLPAVRMAMEGLVTKSLSTISKDMDRLAGGSATLGIFALIALVTCFFSEVTAAINLLLGLLIGGPMIYRGIKSTARLLEQLDPEKTQLPPAASSQHSLPQPPAAELPAVSDTDELASPPVDPSSITEHTTFKLKLPR